MQSNMENIGIYKYLQMNLILALNNPLRFDIALNK